MEFSIRYWTGRTCNNIIQICNAILIAKKYKLKFIQNLYHPIINTFEINFIEDEDNINYNNLYSILEKCNEFYDPYDCTNFCKSFYNDTITIEERHHIYYNLILPNLKINKNIAPLNKNTLVIHIRSGDAVRDNVLGDQVREYNNNNKIILYALPPVKIYELLIEKYDKIIIVAEDRLNPSINYLELKYPTKVTVQTSSLKEDIELILSAQNLAGSSIYNGTFLYTISCLSRNLNNIYMIEFMNRNYSDEYRYPDNVIINVLLTENYYHNYNVNRILEWDNSIIEFKY